MKRLARTRRGGFTLAEVAVTLVIVGIGLLFVLQGLSTSKFTAAQTHNRKLARELALVTLGEVQAGLYREDLADDDHLYGNYGQDGYEEWLWELALGDASLSDEDPERSSLAFDTFADRQRRLDEAEEEDDSRDRDKDEEDTREPYQKVRIRVSYPKLGDFPQSITLERWMPWDDVYGPEEGEEASAPSSETP